MLIPIGFFGGGASGDFEHIQTIIGTGSSGSIEFSSIPQTYKHLELRVVTKIVNGGSSINSNGMRLNGVAGGYDYRIQNFVAGNGELLYANPFDLSYILAGYSNNITGTPQGFGVAMIQVSDYTATKKKQVMIDYTDGFQQRTGKVASNMFVETGAITSIQFFTASGGSFSSTSRFSLYGIKG